jgi:plastocyanin
MSRTALALVATLAASLVVAGAALSSSESIPTLKGTVGPGFSIRLTRNGAKVKSLHPGRYRFLINDRGSIHNFVLEREHPGHFEKTLTGIRFTGVKTFVIRLTAGEWKFYCAPHESVMFGHIKVA